MIPKFQAFIWITKYAWDQFYSVLCPSLIGSRRGNQGMKRLTSDWYLVYVGYFEAEIDSPNLRDLKCIKCSEPLVT